MFIIKTKKFFFKNKNNDFFQAVKNLSFEIAKGETLELLVKVVLEKVLLLKP